VGVDPGITAGFTAGAGAPGAGFAFTPAASSAALVSLACFCCSDFAMLRAWSMASVFCPQAAPDITAIAKIAVVSFIVISTSLPASRASPRWPLR